MIDIGKITRPIGLKGEMRLQIYDNYEAIKNIKYVYLKNRKHKVISLRQYKEVAAIKIDNILSYENADACRNQILSVSKDVMPDLKPDEYYVQDLIGLEVLSYYETQKSYGRLNYIMQNTGQDIYEVKDDSGHTILIPAIKQYIKKIDIGNKEIRVDIPKELEELNR